MPIAPKINFNIGDNDGDVGSTGVHVQSGASLAQYAAYAVAHAAAMDDIVLGAINPIATLSIAIDISGLTGNTLDPASDVEQIAAFQFASADGEPVDVNVPGLLLADVVAGSDALNTADTEIAAFITLMEDGDGTVAPCSIAESDIVATFYARKETRASGKKRR